MLFDIDGTLVDSNYLHIHAWCRAFSDVGIAVESWRIHRCIGMDGTRLLEFLTQDAEQDVQQRAKDLHLQYFTESAPLLKCLPGARELLERIHALGLQIVLATSASEDELSLLREVLDSDDVISAMTSSKDVDVAKPDPGIIQVALERAGVDASHAVLSATRYGTSWRVRTRVCPRSACSAAGCREKSSETQAQKGFSTTRASCAHLRTAGSR